MRDEEKSVYSFLDKEIGLGAGNTFEDFDDKESILHYSIECVSVNERLTCGCGVGPLMSYIESWVDEFESQSYKKETFKYEEKLIQQLKEEGLFSENISENLQKIAEYLYSEEGQTEMLNQALKQIKKNVNSVKDIKFSLSENNALGVAIIDQLNSLDHTTISFINKYINREFKYILEENIDQLFKAFNVSELRDLKKEAKKPKM